MLSTKVIRAIKESNPEYTDLNTESIHDIYIAAGLPEDVADFMTEWYPEYVILAMDNAYYTYGFDDGILYFESESDFDAYLEYNDYTRESDDITWIADVAFDGYILIP